MIDGGVWGWFVELDPEDSWNGNNGSSSTVAAAAAAEVEEGFTCSGTSPAEMMRMLAEEASSVPHEWLKAGTCTRYDYIDDDDKGHVRRFALWRSRYERSWKGFDLGCKKRGDGVRWTLPHFPPPCTVPPHAAQWNPVSATKLCFGVIATGCILGTFLLVQYISVHLLARSS